MNNASTQNLAVGETLSLFEEALLEKALFKRASTKESVTSSGTDMTSYGAGSTNSVSADAGLVEGDAKESELKEEIANCLNVYQAELPLGLQDSNEFSIISDSEVRQLEIPLAVTNVFPLNDTVHQVTENHSAAQFDASDCDETNPTRGQSGKPLALVAGVDTESLSVMTAGSINRTKPSPTPDIENSTRHFEAAMTLAQQMRSKQKPSKNELRTIMAVATSLIAPKHSIDNVATRDGQAQTLNLRQRCLVDLEESRKFVKRSKESLVGIARSSQTSVAGKKNQQQIGYQRSLIDYSASMDIAQRANLFATRSSVEKKIYVNVKKQEQQKRKQAGILICRHLVAALRIQAAHERNAVS